MFHYWLCYYTRFISHHNTVLRIYSTSVFASIASWRGSMISNAVSPPSGGKMALFVCSALHSATDILSVAPTLRFHFHSPKF